MEKKMTAVNNVGDGKLPNKYWVSVSNDYYYYNAEENVSEWIGDVIRDFKSKGETIDIAFNTYDDAKKYIEDNFYIDMKYKDYTINRITIEDRLSGELYEHTREFNPNDATVFDNEHEDTKFTENKLKEWGHQFI
jgi:hypothetical protein